MFKKFALGIAVIAVSFGSAASDDFKLCREVFANGNPPVMQHRETLQPRALCFSAFAVMHSGKRHTPVYVAERLNAAVLQQAKNNQRTNRFFADARLPRAERAELDDYHASGFDRGHMAPAGDMAGDEAMAQSFSLANMVPQYAINNRKTWAGIEKATRKYVMHATGNVYVITGPVFDGTPPTIGANHVWVPQHLFKLVYDPSANRSWVNWLDNTDEAKPGKPISYQELVKRTGIDFLPIKS
ncbi:MAG: DNA/RNA non-specific endonuclease [Proteobacteria bacterium]|nr:DNA/RNA non-specific endonuclease [Pseudomonadota bacterium]